MPSTRPKSKTPKIPDRVFFKIGEVSKIIGVKPYVLRYWETEFLSLAPLKSARNQRLYKKKDVELLLTIKQLLHDRRFTIEGARQYLRSRSVEAKADSDHVTEKDQLAFGFAKSEKAGQDSGVSQKIKGLLSMVREVRRDMKKMISL